VQLHHFLERIYTAIIMELIYSIIQNEDKLFTSEVHDCRTFND